MYKYISCPQCGKRLCRADLGSSIEIICSCCKQEIKVIVDKDGGVHTLPLELKTNFQNNKFNQA